jgi:hypothetical protein
MLINKDFVFLPIPKNASTSIVYSVMKWGIDVDFGSVHINKVMSNQVKSDSEFWHPHYVIDFLKKKFPNKEIIGIKRNSTDRFISALKYMIIRCKKENINLKYDFETLSENNIIEIFSNLFLELNSFLNPIQYNEMEAKLLDSNIKNIIKKYLSDDYMNFNSMYLLNFTSQYFWGLNNCDIIIDIKNLNEFESHIKKFKSTFNLIKSNTSDKVDLKITKTEKLNIFVNNSIDSKWVNKVYEKS